MNIKPASEKQLRWLASLLDERDTNGWTDNEQARLAQIREAFAACEENDVDAASVNVLLVALGYKIVSMDGFRYLLEKLKTSPVKIVEGQANIATTDGMYKHGDTFYKLKFAKTGNLWAHKLVMLMTPEEAKDAAAAGDKRKAAQFVFAGSPKSLGITEDMKLTYEDAKAFGALYSTCCECGRLLTNDLSVYLGIGPVCGGREFGGDFKFMIDEAKLAIKPAS